ncbi:hypothetical protein M23134_04611 [Microscilla marina ATCC 23134]|uniref:Uncharacterized protein n=1 Tax=Microscilla marina ATCC 23134 TaxID=313606 RepID=A1ZTB1_MICM2|nr:hypothetical protein M23134_04611 [Microscilla marina ATCC 23134]
MFFCHRNKMCLLVKNLRENMHQEFEKQVKKIFLGKNAC